VLVDTDAEIAWQSVARHVVGEGADRLAKLGRVLHGLGALHAIGFKVAEKTLNLIGIDQRADLLAGIDGGPAWQRTTHPENR
jgi:hypothetical protein